MTLLNVSFLVADNEIACEDLLVGLPVLRHLGTDFRTLLERNWSTLHVTDCASVFQCAAPGSLGRLMIARLNHRTNSTSTKPSGDQEPDPHRPLGDHFAHEYGWDPFTDPSLIYLDDKPDDELLRDQIAAMIEKENTEDFPEEHSAELYGLVWGHSAEFCTTFSPHPAKVDPLRIHLTEGSRPIRVKIRNYSVDQREFMESLVDKLVENNLVYPNPSARRASSRLIVPKPGPSRSLFTVDLRPVNRYTIRHQFPMPIVAWETDGG